MADTYPTEQDLMSFLFAANQIDSETAPTGRYAALGYQQAVDAARSEFERRTGRTFLAASATETFDPVTSRDGLLSLGGDWMSIDEVEVDGEVLGWGDGYQLEPYQGPPYRFIRFLTLTTAPTFWQSRGTVSVTGTRGFGDGVPDDVWQAILQRAAAMLMPSIASILTSGYVAAGVQSVRLGDADATFGVGAAGASSRFASGWQSYFEDVAAQYRRVGIV